MKGFDITLFPMLNLNDPMGFYLNLEKLKKIFEEYQDDLSEVKISAQKYKTVMDKHDPFIQSYSAKTCPYCGTICCANRHGVPDFGDLIIFLALDLRVPHYNLVQDERAPCQFIGERGCKVERILRPYRCTWYYCDPMLVQIEIDKPSEYRRFIKEVGELAETRGETLYKFWEFWKAKGYDK